MFVLLEPASPSLDHVTIDAALARTVAVCMAKVEETSTRMTEAADMADFERGGRVLNGLCRNVRQAIAMKQRQDREQASLAADQRREAEGERKVAQQTRDIALGLHRGPVRRHFERVLWDEYEADDAQEIFEDLDARLFELSEAEAFLDTPVRTLIDQLTEEFMPPAEDAASGAEADEDDEPEPEADEVPEPEPPVVAAEPEPPPEPEPEPEPPPRPPDPPIEEPYIPPWEKLRPGQRWPGSSGW